MALEEGRERKERGNTRKKANQEGEQRRTEGIPGHWSVAVVGKKIRHTKKPKEKGGCKGQSSGKKTDMKKEPTTSL